MKKYPKGDKNKKTGKLKRFFVKSALVLALSTGAVSCNDGNTYTVKPGETIWALYQKTDKSMTSDEFKIAFITVNEGHIGIEEGIIRANEKYIIPTNKIEKNDTPIAPEVDSLLVDSTQEDIVIINDDNIPEIDDIPNEMLDSLMQGETPIATYLKLYKAYENINIENKPSFPAVIAHIEQETGMYGQWTDKEFKNEKEKYFEHNNPFNITYKDSSNVEDFYEKKDNVYKDGRRQRVMVKFNDYNSMEDGLKDYIENVTDRQYLLDHLGLGSIGVNNPLVYLYKLESTGYMQGLLGAGDIDVYLSRQLNRPYDEKTPIFLVTRTDSTDEMDYEVNKISRLMAKESELKKGRKNFMFGETVEADGVFMTKFVFKEGGNHNLKEDRFSDQSVKDQKDYAKKSIDKIKEMK